MCYSDCRIVGFGFFSLLFGVSKVNGSLVSRASMVFLGECFSEVVFWPRNCNCVTIYNLFG